MKVTHKEIHSKLQSIYEKHRKKYRRNPDSKQMCCMWSTSAPPDTIEGTVPFCDIEDAFDISIDVDDSLELYDMNLAEATIKIANIVKQL